MFEIRANFNERGWENVDKTDDIWKALWLICQYDKVFSAGWKLCIFVAGIPALYFRQDLPNGKEEAHNGKEKT